MLIDVANYVTFSFLLSGYSGVYISESAVACASLRVPYKTARLPVLVHLPARCVLWFGHTAESKWAGLRNHCIRLADLPLLVFVVFRISAFKLPKGASDLCWRLYLRNMIHSFSWSKARR